MKKLVTAILTVSAMTVAAGVSADTASTLEQASTALKGAKAAGFEWRLIDKSAGKKSASLTELMENAEKANKDGNAAEAERIAKRVIFAANGGMTQAKNPGKAYYPAR